MNFIYWTKFVLKSYLLQKNVTCSSGKLSIEFPSSNAKNTSPEHDFLAPKSIQEANFSLY